MRNGSLYKMYVGSCRAYSNVRRTYAYMRAEHNLKNNIACHKIHYINTYMHTDTHTQTRTETDRQTETETETETETDRQTFYIHSLSLAGVSSNIPTLSGIA